jgi:hypothetical protein
MGRAPAIRGAKASGPGTGRAGSVISILCSLIEPIYCSGIFDEDIPLLVRHYTRELSRRIGKYSL